MSEILTPRELRKARWIGRGGSALLTGIGATWRVRRLNEEYERELRASRRGYIYAFWHGQLLPLTHLFRQRGVVVLVSLNRDGEYIAQTIHRMGFDTVRGSSSRGGLRALLEMARRGSAGEALAFTPDGPRGPRARVQPGVVIAAQRARIPILPLAVSAWPRRTLSSWDRMMIPLPFARVVVAFSEPLLIPADIPLEQAVTEWSPRVEAALNAVTELTDREARRWAGVAPDRADDVSTENSAPADQLSRDANGRETR